MEFFLLFIIKFKKGMSEFIGENIDGLRLLHVCMAGPYPRSDLMIFATIKK
jgi:hypothetical protein